MSSQTTVYTSASSWPITWPTDRCQISTGSTAVTYNVAYPPSFADTMFSAPIQVPANSTKTVIVGVGNQLTVTGATFTATTFGTTSSGTAGN